MKKLLLLVGILCLVIHAYSQQVYGFKGIVVDVITNEPLPRATIVVDNSFQVYSSDDGQFTGASPLKNVQFYVSYIGYDSLSLKVNLAKTDSIVIKLKPSIAALKEVEVLPQLPAYLFFGSKETEVIDYVFWNDRTLIALYNYYRKKCYLVLLDKNNNMIAEQPIPANIDYLYMSCIFKTYAVMSDATVYEISPSSTGISIKPCSFFMFYRKVLHYVDFYDSYFYVFDESKSKQDRLYRVENTEKKTLWDLVYIVNPETQRGARQSAAAIKADRMKATHDVIWDFDPNREGDYLEDAGLNTFAGFVEKQRFQQQFVNHPTYAPLFVHDSSVLVFDFYHNKRLAFYPDGTFADSLRISFHQHPGWQPWIYRDVTMDQYYTSYLSADHKTEVQHLNITTCTTTPGVLLHYPSAEKIKVRKGYVYYVYQPYPNRNNVFLFRQKIE